MTETTATKGAFLAYPRLCIAYFCQFAIWGAWAGALGGYTIEVLKFSGGNVGWLYNAMPIGAIIAPLIIGPIADRYFASQKVMSLLHFISGIALLICGFLCLYGLQTFPVLMGLMLLSGICYTATMGLINSVVFQHLPKASMAPYVFVFGTFGWIAATLYIAGFCDGASTPYFFFVGGVVSVFLAFYSLTLPNTPPKGASASGEKSNMFAVLTMFKNFPFLIFVICAFLASIPANNYFWPSIVPFLSERGYPSPVALTALNQVSEIVFMLALAFCIPRLGLKNVLLIGMAAWSIRYFCFAMPYFETAMIGLLVHGFCYAFLYIAAYMYAEKVAPAHLKASAQSMMIFLLIGVSQLLGGIGFGQMVDRNPPRVAAVTVPSAQLEPAPPVADVRVSVPAWSQADDSWFQYLDLAAQVNRLLGKEEEASTDRAIDISRLPLVDGRLTPQVIESIGDDESLLVQDGVVVSHVSIGGLGATLDDPITATVQFKKEDLRRLAVDIAETENFSLTRDDWLAAQSRDWTTIYLVPAVFIAVCFVVFLLLGRNPKDEVAEKQA